MPTATGTGTPRLSAYSTPATPAARSLSIAPGTAAAAAAAAAAQQQQQPAAATAPPLPPPATFDIIPHIHTLLARLLIPKPPSAATAADDAKPDDAVAGGSSSTTTTTAKANGGPTSGGAGGPTDPDSQPLEIHQLAAASGALKVRLQKARQACTRLGDVERTTEEQAEEIAELEERVAKLREVLADLGVGTGAAVAAPTEGGESEMVLRAAAAAVKPPV